MRNTTTDDKKCLEKRLIRQARARTHTPAPTPASPHSLSSLQRTD